MSSMLPAISDQYPLSLESFLHQAGVERFLTIQDGQLVCLTPESAEAQALYQQVLAAIEAGMITDLRHGRSGDPPSA